MARSRDVPGAQASSIQFSNLAGFPDQVPVLMGKVGFRRPQIVREEIQDCHSLEPQYTEKFQPGMVKMTIKLPVDSSWITSETIRGASLEVSFVNGLNVAFTDVKMYGEAVEEDLTAGTTNELTFGFVSATES